MEVAIVIYHFLRLAWGKIRQCMGNDPQSYGLFISEAQSISVDRPPPMMTLVILHPKERHLLVTGTLNGHHFPAIFM